MRMSDGSSDVCSADLPQQGPEVAYPQVLTASGEAHVRALLARMSVEQKVGQIIQADIGSVTPQDVREYHLGSVLNGGNSGPGGNDLAPARDWLAPADAFYAASVEGTPDRKSTRLNSNQ